MTHVTQTTSILRMPTLYILLALLFVCAGKLEAVPYTEKEIERKIEKLKDDESKEAKDAKAGWSQLLELIKEKQNSKAKAKEWKKIATGLDSKSLFDPNAYRKSITASPSEVENYLSQLNVALSSLNQQKTLLESLAANEAERLKTLPTIITKLRASDLITNANPAATGTDIEALLPQARYDAAVAEINALEEEMVLLKKKAPFIEKAQIQIEETIVELSNERKKVAKKADEISRNTDARLREDIKDLTGIKGLDPVLSAMLEKSNARLDSLYGSDGVKARLEAANTMSIELDELHSTIVNQYKYAVDRIALLEKANLEIDSQSRQLFRRQREALPTKNELDKQLEKLIRQQAANELKILDIKSSLKAMPSNKKQYVKNLLKENLGGGNDSNLNEAQVTRILTLFETVSKNNLEQRGELTVSLNKAIALTERNIKSSREYSEFIDTRLLWIASHDSMGAGVFVDEWQSLYKHLQPSEMLAWWGTVLSSISQSPLNWIVLGLLVVVLFCLRRRLNASALAYHAEAREVTCQTIKPTLLGLLSELAIVLPIFLLLAGFGWLVKPDYCYNDGFRGAAAVYFIFSSILRLSRKEGFLISNFKIGEHRNAILQRVAGCSLLVLLPVWTLHKVLAYHANVETGGRLLTVLSLLLMAAILHQVLRPKNKMFAVKGQVTLRSYLFYGLGVFSPIILALATVIGYYTTVLLLHMQFIYSIRVILLVLLTGAIMKRWLLVSRRRYAEKSLKEEDTEEYAALAGNETLTERDIRRQIISKITEIRDQSKKLITVFQVVVIVLSLIAIWANTLPALKVLDEVNLWTTSVPAAEAADAASASSSGSSSSTPNLLNPLQSSEAKQEAPKGYRWVTLQNLLSMFIIFVLTYIASKNIPGLLKMTILDRFNLKAGGAFAVTTGVRYVIIIIGIIWGFNIIGVSWSKVQWLAAAITLGIGFGLQEIFANFVAGIIMLLERPVRIGDLVTIGGVNGRVTKIEMRATTILQFSNKELLVPNKEFITGQLVNWTLSDNVMRAEIAVGIAYGSDTALAKELLYKCASENSRTLKERDADVIFHAFGASSLDFILRVYVTQADDLIPVQSELHFAIDAAFREANIEIAFPQQDIHIRSIENNIPIESVGSTKE